MNILKESCIPGAFSNLPSLREIHINTNILTEIPTGFAFQCNELILVDFSSGLINEIGNCYCCLHNFKSLILSLDSFQIALGISLRLK